MRPEKPLKAIESKPAATKSTGVPFINAGIFASFTFCRIPAISTIASKKPTAVPREYTMDSKKLYPLLMLFKVTARIAQFVVIKAR